MRLLGLFRPSPKETAKPAAKPAAKKLTWREKAQLITQMRNEGNADGIHPFLNDTERGVQSKAILTLGDLGDKRVVQTIIGKLQSQDWGVRQSAAITLGKFGDKAAVAPIIEALKRERREIIGRGHPEQVGTHPATGETLLVDGPLNMAKNPRTGATRVIDDNRRFVQSSMVSALGRLGDASAIPLLEEICKEPSYDNVRKSAQEALEKLRANISNLT